MLQQWGQPQGTNSRYTIPVVATIDGIEVKIEARKSQPTGGGQDDVVKIVKSDGSIGAEDKSTDTAYTTSDAIRTYGGPSDLWSEAWSDTDINDIDFGVVLAIIVSRGIGGQAVSVDHITITVYYTALPTPAVTKPSLSGKGWWVGEKEEEKIKKLPIDEPFKPPVVTRQDRIHMILNPRIKERIDTETEINKTLRENL